MLRPGILSVGVLGRSRTIGSSAVPTPDAVFSTRTGLNITDIINGEIINISHFPVTNFYGITGDTVAPLFDTNTSISYSGGSMTYILMFQPLNATTNNALTFKPYSYTNNRFIINHGTKKISFYVGGTLLASTGLTVPDSANYTSNWYLIVCRHESGGVNGVYQVYKMGDSSSVATTTSASTPDSQTGAPHFYNLLGTTPLNRIALFAYWNTFISNADIAAIVNSLTFPNAEPLILHTWDGDANHYRRGYNAIDNTIAWIGSTTDPRTPHTMCNDDYIEYNSFAYGKYQLEKGFTQIGNYNRPYLPSGLKGAGSTVDDVEHLSTGCIHNMTNSYINFSGISDATIKAIFDKSNRTYWKSSIETAGHYIDAGVGYYGLWHPTQLQRDFVTLHAETGHENHIYASLRTSGIVVTGITSLQVYKTNQT